MTRSLWAVVIGIVVVVAGCGTPYARRHHVQTGETVTSIARDSGVPEEELRRFNHLGPGDRARPGDILFLPGVERKRPLSPPRAVSRPPVVAQQPQARPAPPPGRSPKNLAPLRWPLEGTVLRGFGVGPAGASRGIDLAAHTGTTVSAAGAGRVTYAGKPVAAYGPLVIVEHPGGLYTVYGNLSAVQVQQGATVRTGQAVGTSGTEGQGMPPHLHFEVRQGDRAVDPFLFLPPR